MSRIIAVIEGEPITETADDGRVSWQAKMAIDCDGIGPHYGDPCAQSDTSLHYKGEPLNADKDKFIVVPPIIPKSVKGKVLGCQAKVTNTHTDLVTHAVVGDIGPKK